MPAAFVFHSGSVCGPVDAYSTLFCRSHSYALSISDTMIAMCWNQRSLLLESAGIGRPFGVKYSVSSIDSSPSFMRTTRARTPNSPCRCSYSEPKISLSDTFSKDRTLEKKSTDRSISLTVRPTESSATTAGVLPASATESKQKNPTRVSRRCCRTLCFIARESLPCKHHAKRKAPI